jgi:hypothetical protein
LTIVEQPDYNLLDFLLSIIAEGERNDETENKETIID